MPPSLHDEIRALVLIGTLSIGWLVIQASLMLESNLWAGSLPVERISTSQGDVEQGRKVFNGKGICFYCHGTDGYLDQRPSLAQDTEAIIARLNPKPADLRDPGSLRLKTDKERYRAIREGHTGTGMLPDTTLKDEEIVDLLAYLSTLRHKGSSKKTFQ